MDAVIGIDLGGTKISAALIDRNGRIIAQKRTATTVGRGAEVIVQKMIALANGLMKIASQNKQRICGIGVGSPGCINARTGTVLSPAFNIPDWQGTELAQKIRKETGIPTFAGNDANVAALGEKMFGAGKGVNDLLLITLGTGIGGGLILNGKVHLGKGFLAGEFGHMSIEARGGRACVCGNRGCIEAYASGPGIAMTAKEKLRKGARSAIMDRHGSLDEITSKVVAEAAAEGDALALSVVSDTARYLGIALANVVNLLDLERIIIGGAVSKMGEMLFAQVREETRARIIPGTGQQVQIVGAALGEKAGVIGAAALAWASRGMQRAGKVSH